MEPTELNNPAPAIPQPVPGDPGVQPAPAPVNWQQPIQPQPYMPAPQYSGGTAASGGAKNWFANINITDVCVLGLMVTTLLLIGYYYRTQIKSARTNQSQMQKKIDEVEANVKEALGESYQADT